VKEMLLQEFMHLVVIAMLSAAFPKMLDPVETCVLNLWRQALLHSTALDLGYKCAGSIQATNVLLEGGRYEPYAAIGQRLMRLLLVHLEVWILAPIVIKEEVAK
jgi:hypothetical protein